MPFERNVHRLRFFGNVADELVRVFAPCRTFDAGCALGLLVECLWDRGVHAHGRDISAWAIEQVRADVRPFCKVGSIADPIEGEYDLLTCIEVLEHMPDQDALAAIAAMAAAAPRILFSSSPTDLDGPTHCTVRPPAYWLARWAEVGFAPMPAHDAGYLAPHAFLLERSETGRTPRDLAAFADRVRDRVGLMQLGVRAAAAERERTQLTAEVATLTARIAAADAELAGERHKLEAAVAKVRAEAEAELVRRAREDRRIRAGAAQRAAAARVEATEMRVRAAEAEARAAEIGKRIAEAGQADEAEAARRDDEMRAAWTAWRDMAAAHDRLLASTAWRATWPLRASVELLPRPVRRRMRQGLSAAWWAATGQLPSRLRRRRAVVRDVHAVNASPLFDAAWYVARNSDVSASGLDPTLHFVTVGGPEGRDPGPGFSTQAYLERHPDAAAHGRPALLHFLENGHPPGPADIRRWTSPRAARGSG